MLESVVQQFGNYRLMNLLYEDGFAKTYLGEHNTTKILVTIKVLYARLTDNNLEKFLTMAQGLVNFKHLHIVQILEFGVENGIPFLVIEYAPHGNLRQRHPKGTLLPLSTIISYVKQAADGLKYAHECNLVHRDIKPENIQLGRHDEVLLSDFSTALIAESLHITSNPGQPEIAGTILYMAPEQINGGSVPASDQYALGVVVYEWLSGNCPFDGSFNEVAIQHLMMPPPSLHELFPAISPELEQVVMTALAKDPKERFGTINAFANALSQVRQADMSKPFVPSFTTKPLPDSNTPVVTATPLAGVSLLPAASTVLMTPPTSGPAISQLSPIASPVTPPTGMPVTLDTSPVSEQSTESGLIVSRRSVVAGLIGVGLVAASGGLVWQTQRLLASGSPAKPAPASASIYHIAPGSKALKTSLLTYRGHTAQVEAVAWSPNGQTIASASYDKTVQVWEAISGSPLLTYLGHTGKLRLVEYSPDSTLIASSSDDQTVQIWEAATGKRRLTYKGHRAGIHGLAFSPDKKLIVSGSADQTVQIWEVTTGKRLLTYTGHTGQVRTVGWSHNGQYIASGGDDFKVHVWEAATGNNVYVYQGHKGAVGSLAWSPDDKQIASSGTNLDHTARIWDATTGNHVLIYRGHQRAIWSMAWSPNGKYIVTGSNDNTAQVWEATTGKPFITYIGHTDQVVTVAWAPESQRVVSGSRDNTAQVWSVQ